MPRQARLDAPGTLHHVIVRGIERGKIVKDASDRAAFVERLGASATDTTTVVYAWALLDNHAHLLVRSGPELLAGFMRRLLTRYAVYFNRRHRRHGHVFQNRYKSIVCDEDEYFAELVRYIHLNPLRAGIVEDMKALDRYSYAGHGVIMGKVKAEWQDSDYVLSLFGHTVRQGRRNYREFVEAGIGEGKRPDLVGGGLVRSLGGWSEVGSMRRRKEKRLTDERVLGSGAFVEKLLAEADERVRRQVPASKRGKLIASTIGRVCREHEVAPGELEGGSTRRHVSAARREVVRVLAKEHGIPLATIARSVGVSTSGVWRILERVEKKSN